MTNTYKVRFERDAKSDSVVVEAATPKEAIAVGRIKTELSSDITDVSSLEVTDVVLMEASEIDATCEDSC